MKEYHHTFDSMDIVLTTALFGGYWKDVWWPFWMFAFIMTVPVLFAKKP